MSTATGGRARHTFSSGDYLQSLMAELDRAQISRRIRQARKEAGFKNQGELADVMRVHWRTVQDWENPKNQNVPWDRLEELAQVCGATKVWLLHGEEATPPAVSPTTDERIARLESELAEALRILRRLEPPSEEEVA